MSDSGFTFVGEEYLTVPQATVVLPFGVQKLALRYVARVRGSIVLTWCVQPNRLSRLDAIDVLVVHSPKNEQTITVSDMLRGGITHLVSGESLLFKTLNAHNEITRTVLVSHVGSARPPYLEVERYVCHRNIRLK